MFPVYTLQFVQRALLAQQLHDRAQWTQHRLGHADTHGISQQEETITETVLLDLARGAPRLSITTHTRWEESNVSGADWVWWWKGRDSWFGGLVQAKKLKDPLGRPHYEIGYRPAQRDKSRPPRPLQIETLLDHSATLELPALYALYNPFARYPRAWNCPVHTPGSDAEGITVADALSLRNLLRRNAPTGEHYAKTLPLQHVAKFARPWSCLATCELANCVWSRARTTLVSALGFSHDPWNMDLAYALAYTHFALRVEPSLVGRDVDLQAAVDHVARGVRQEPPRYVTEPDMLADGPWPTGRPPEQPERPDRADPRGEPDPARDRVFEDDPTETLDGINRVIIIQAADDTDS